MKGRFFITGDIHGDVARLILFIHRMKLKSGDKICVLGDAGIFWRNDKKDADYIIKYWDEYSNGVELYFIDGNHENFNLLNNLPVDENNMGIVSDKIHYLRRGCVYEINGKRILSCGGADSVDWYRRTEGLSWWKEETISQADIDRVPAGHYDYVFTHCCPLSVFDDNRVYLITLSALDQSKINHNSEEKLEDLSNKITFDNWYFGHYHIDKKFDNGFRCFLNDFEEVR